MVTCLAIARENGLKRRGKTCRAKFETEAEMREHVATHHLVSARKAWQFARAYTVDAILRREHEEP